MSEIQNTTELNPAPSENETLALQILVVIVGFTALLLPTLSAIHNEIKLSTLIAYAAAAFCFWNLFKAIHGAPNAFKPKGEPIRLVDFALYLIVGFTVLMIATSLYQEILSFVDIKIQPLLFIAVVLSISCAFLGEFLSFLSIVNVEDGTSTLFLVLIGTLTVYGFWRLSNAIRGAPNAFRPRGKSNTLKVFTLNLIVGISALGVARIMNTVREGVTELIVSRVSSLQ